MDDDVEVPAGTNQLAALTKQLEAAQAKGAKPGAAADDGVFMGMTMGSLMIGLVLSTVGVALVRYARVTGQWMYAGIGALLFALPFVITDALWLGIAGAGAFGLMFFLRRFVTF